MTTVSAKMYQSARNCRTLCFQPILMILDVLESQPRKRNFFSYSMLPKHIVNYHKSCSILPLSVQINLTERIQSNMPDMRSNSLVLIAVNNVFNSIKPCLDIEFEAIAKTNSFLQTSSPDRRGGRWCRSNCSLSEHIELLLIACICFSH